MDLFEELVAVKGAIELDFVSSKSIKNNLDEYFQKITLENSEGLLTLLLKKELLTQSQIEFLAEGVSDDKDSGSLPDKIDATNREQVEFFLGLRENRVKNKPADNMRIISCPHCNAKYRLKMGSKSNKFRCAKCRQYFFINLDDPHKEKETVANSDLDASVSLPAGLNPSKTVTLDRSGLDNLINKAQQEISAKGEKKSELEQTARDKDGKEAKLPPTRRLNIEDVNKKDNLSSEHWSSTSKIASKPSTLFPSRDLSINKLKEQIRTPSTKGKSSGDPTALVEALKRPTTSESTVSNAAPTDPSLATEQISTSTNDVNEEPTPNLFDSANIDSDGQAENLWNEEANSSDEQPESLWTSDDATPQEPQKIWDSGMENGIEQEPQQAVWDSFDQEMSQIGQEQQAPIEQAPSSSQEKMPNLESSDGQNPQSWDDGTMNTDFLKVPTENIAEASDFLNITTSTNKDNQFDAGSTMELDIRSTSLYKGNKKAPGQKTVKEASKLTQNLSQAEGAAIIKYALNYDFISQDDATIILDAYYDKLSAGESTENLACLLMLEGYVTKFQFPTLEEAMDKDQKADRMPKDLDMASREAVEMFIGLKETKKIARITCPHCKAKFRARISVKGGKFRCGKCQKKFFLST